MKAFTSLHTMTEYSFMESSIKLDNLISFAKKNKLSSLAITDHNNMFGVAQFIHKAKKENIKPIIGIDIDVQDFRLILLAKNFEGYKHLVHLASLKGKNIEIKIDDISEQNIFIIDHPEFGYFKRYNRQLKKNNYFIATDENIGNAINVKYTRTLAVEDLETIDLIDQLKGNVKDIENIPYVFMGNENDPATKQAMIIAEECNVEFPEFKNTIPEFKNEDNLPSISFLKKLINQEAKTKLSDITNKEEYFKRVKYEIEIIEKLGFEDYFLIIADLVKWSKNNKIIIGPGRGSAAGSLVSFLLGITEIDPLKFDLLFERFLNPDRVTMPDIDIDIQDNKREEVVNYLFQKYGEEKVGLISTFQRLAAKSSIRDVGRLLNVSVGEINEFSKLIPNDATLEEAYNTSPRFKAAVDRSEVFTKIYKLAKRIEGLPRQNGTHAAGVVLSKEKLENIVPTILSSENLNQIQFDMDHLEEYGLLKIDLLGLRNLTIIKKIQEEVYKNYKKRVDLSKIKNDKLTNDLLSSGKTNGIFQLESYGMKKTLKQVGVSSIDDLAAIISLYRPGPMEYIKVYADRKKGFESFGGVSKNYDYVLKNTYGIILYQEQIMQIAQFFAGMPFSQADILRRAIGKKNSELLNSLKEDFIQGAIKNGHNLDLIKKVYKNIERFADYGFNKSHAYAYGVLAYRMAFLKARFKFEFYTSLIESSVGSLNSLKLYINEAKEKNINIIAPNINSSDIGVFNDKKSIVLPLSIIKGLGVSANQKIIEERKKGLFIDFFDLVARLKINSLGDSIIQLLIKGSALRDFGNMQTLIDSLPAASRYAEMILTGKGEDRKLNFDILPKPRLITSEKDFQLEHISEKQVYGFNLVSFPSSKYENKHKIIDSQDNKNVIVSAQILAIKKITTKNNSKICVAVLEDSSATIEAFAFESVYKFIEKTKKGSLVKVKISYKNNKYTILEPWEEISNE